MDTIEELPPIDERLALPGARYEIIDGVVTFVPPALPPHAEHHHVTSVLIGAHVRAEFKVAIDMLTRTSKIDDIAPDVSVFPREPDPKTGRRQLEHLAFEIVSTESMSHASTKAAKLVGRGVRRVFVIDIQRKRVVEWSKQLETWKVLDVRGHIEDATLAVPLSVNALLEAVNTDDDVARALIAKHNPVIEEAFERGRAEGVERGRAEGVERGRAEGVERGRAEAQGQAVIAVLLARGIVCSAERQREILTERDLARLSGWLLKAATCKSIEELFDLR